MGSMMLLVTLLAMATLTPTDSWSLSGFLSSASSNRDSSSSPGARLLDRRFTRYENLFNDDNNASLYLPRFDLGRRNDEPATTTTLPPASNNTDGRSLDMSSLFSDSSESQEGRIVNDKPKMDIQGFIPIISLAKPQAPLVQQMKPQQPVYGYPGMESFQQMQQVNPHGYMEQGKSNSLPAFGGIQAAIQNLAAPFKGLRRRGQEMIPGQDCLCVPFYMCTKGYLETTAKNAISSSSYASAPPSSPNKEYYEQQLAAAQSEIASSIPTQFNPFNQERITNQNQPIYQASNQAISGSQYDSSNLPINERSVDGKEQARSTHFPSNGTETEDLASGRMLGQGNSCGLMRTCCRFAPEFAPQNPYTSASFSSQEVLSNSNNHHQVSQFPGVFHGQQGANPYFRPPPSQMNHHQQQSMIPKRPSFSMPQGSFEILGASLLRPKPQGFSPPQFGPIVSQVNSGMNQMPYQKPFMKPLVQPQRFYQPNQMMHQIQQTQRHGYSSGQSSAMASLPVPSYSSNHLGSSSSVSYGQCGVRSYSGTQGRVQNLQYHEASADFGEYPWQAALLKRLGPADSLYVCGGVLISPNFILTAAHCIKENRAEDLKVRLGEWDVHREDEFYPYVERMVQEIIIHPDFFQGNLVNDIALIRLDSSVELSNPHILPACMPDSYETFVGHRCWVTGWGKNSFGHQGEYQSVLKEVDLPVMSNGECEHNLRRTRLGPYYQLHQGFMCAGGERGKDACEGDGGSPLVCEVNGSWKVAGLVSWGIGCGQPGIPGVYANVAHYRHWIDSIVARYGRSLDSSESSSSYAAAGIIQERSNDGNETIISGSPSTIELTTLPSSSNSTMEVASTTESTVDEPLSREI